MAGGTVVQDFVRPFRGHQLPPAVSAGSPSYVQARRARELDGSNPYASAGSIDQDRLTCASLSTMEERAVCRGVRNPNCRALFKGNVCGKRKQIRLFAESLLRVRAGETAGKIHPVARNK